jgi:hypothetical protein
MHPLLIKLAEYYAGKNIPCAFVRYGPDLALFITRDNAHHGVKISIDEDGGIYCMIDFPGIVPEGKRRQVMEYIACESSMDPSKGRFHLCAYDGSIDFCITFNNVGPRCPSKRMGKMIETCASIADYHVPALAGMLHGNMSPSEAAEHAREWDKNIQK